MMSAKSRSAERRPWSDLPFARLGGRPAGRRARGDALPGEVLEQLFLGLVRGDVIAGLEGEGAQNRSPRNSPQTFCAMV